MKKIKLQMSKDFFLLHLRANRGDHKLGDIVRAIMGEIKCNKKKSFTPAKKE